MAAVEASLGEIVTFGLADDYYQKYSGRVQKLAIDDLVRAAKKAVHPEAMTWIVVGDRAQIEPKIRELGYKEVFIIDADGNVVK
jgi:predicted Zn-dependent peptidase